MSIAAVQEFLNAVATDPALQEAIAKAMESDNDRQAVTDLAHARGYDFTSDELAQEIANREAEVEQKVASGELSEDELEAVAGGKVTPFIPIVSNLTPGIPIPRPKW